MIIIIIIIIIIARLTGCKNFVGKRKKFIFNAFVDLKPVGRFENRSDMWEGRVKRNLCVLTTRSVAAGFTDTVCPACL